MAVDVLIDHLVELRDAGELRNATDPWGLPEWLTGLLWRIEDRSQLDRIVEGLPGGEAVADRAERVLRLRGAVPASVDEIEEWSYECLVQWAGLARRRCEPGPVLEAFEALGRMPVEVVDRHSDESFPLNASLLGIPADEDGEMTAEQLRLVHGESFELLFSEPSRMPAVWTDTSEVFFMVLRDEPMLGRWLLAPVADWEFDYEPFFKLWQAGVGLWVSPEMVEAVRGGALWGDSAWGTGLPLATDISEADAEWLETAGRGGHQLLAKIASCRKTGSRDIDASEMGLLSLPPALVVEGGWRNLNFWRNPGIDPSRLSELDHLGSVNLTACDLKSFDIDFPPGLSTLSLNKNQLTHWPSALFTSRSQVSGVGMQYNQLRSIPDEIDQCSAIGVLNLGDNLITRVSANVGQLPKLKRLSLHSNRQLAVLPVEILELPADCEVVLFGTALPESFQNAKTIAELREVWGDLKV